MKSPDHYINPNNYTLEVSRTFDKEFVDRVVEIYKQYAQTGKSNPENYSEERVRWNFKTRFEHGFYIVRCKDEVLLTFGIDDFKGWGVVSRYLKQPYFIYMPVCMGYGFPEAIKHLGDEIKGLCCTHNIEHNTNRTMLSTGIVKFSKLENKARGGIYETAYHLATKTSRIETPIMYRGVVQVGYTFSGDQVPPFDIVGEMVLPTSYTKERFRKKHGSTDAA